MSKARWKALLGAVVATAAVLVPAATTAQAAVADQTFTVWNWNIAGNTIHHGSTTTGILKHAVDSIINRDADFVSFNEICWEQYKAIQSQLTARGWPASSDFSRFAATREPKVGICTGDEEFGQALFSRQDLGNSRQYELPWDGRTGTRKLLCAPLQANPLMKFCTVHITTGPKPGEPDNRIPQLKEMLRLLDGFHAAGETYLVAGDFNVQPDYEHLDSYYAASANTVNNPGNTGAHRELDDADPNECPGYGEFTATVTPERAPPCGTLTKLDLIIARESRIVGSYSGDSLAGPTDCAVEGKRCSDHRVTIGTVTLRVSTA